MIAAQQLGHLRQTIRCVAMALGALKSINVFSEVHLFLFASLVEQSTITSIFNVEIIKKVHKLFFFSICSDMKESDIFFKVLASCGTLLKMPGNETLIYLRDNLYNFCVVLSPSEK